MANVVHDLVQFTANSMGSHSTSINSNCVEAVTVHAPVNKISYNICHLLRVKNSCSDV